MRRRAIHINSISASDSYRAEAAPAAKVVRAPNFVMFPTTFPFIAQAAAPQQGSFASMLVPMVLIFAIFYFLMIRPQQRKEKERQKAIDAMRVGQRVLFAGGLIGTISEVKQNTFILEIASGAKIEVARGAVQRALKDDETPAAAE